MEEQITVKMRRLHITEKDQLLAAGLSSFIVTFLMIGYHVSYDRIGTAFSYDSVMAKGLMIIGIFAAGALVFSISPITRETLVQKLLGLLFASPALTFAAILVWWFISSHLAV